MPVTSAAIAGASRIITGTVDNLFKNKVYKSQAEANLMKARVDLLSEQEKYNLALRLQDAKNDTDMANILADSTTSIKNSALESIVKLKVAEAEAAGNQNVAQSKTNTTKLVVASSVIMVSLILVVVLLKMKKDGK